MIKKNMSIRKISMFLLFTMIIYIFSPLIGLKTYAADANQTINNLEIVSKADEYYPGQTIYIKGDWSIPNDTRNKQYKEGNTFSMTIPDGLIPQFESITLSDLGIGTIVGNEVVFKFTDQIEGLANRKGGFTLKFKVDSPKDEGKFDINLESKDENGNIILKDAIVVNNPKAGDMGDTDEYFTKGKQDYTSDGLLWYVRINRNGGLTSSKVSFEDTIGPDHELKENSIIVYEHTSDDDQTDITGSLNIIVSSDKKGFVIKDLNLEGGYKGYRNYTINYETIYTGSEIEGVIYLDNTGELITEDMGVLKPEYTDDTNGVSKGELDLNQGGWGIGTSWLTFKMKKVDSVTKKGLKNVRFKLTHRLDKNFIPIEFETDENGEYKHHTFINNGAYLLEEIEAPAGYKKMEPKAIRIIYDKNNPTGEQQVFEFEVENELEAINVKGIKKWFDKDGGAIESRESIALSLYGDNQIVRQIILPKGQAEFEFKNLPKQDSTGKNINYIVEEVKLEGYKTEVTGNAELGFIVTNTEIEEPIEPIEPEKPEKPVEPGTPQAPNRPDKPIQPDTPDSCGEQLVQTGTDINLLIPMGLIIMLIGLGFIFKKKTTKE